MAGRFSASLIHFPLFFFFFFFFFNVILRIVHISLFFDSNFKRPESSALRLGIIKRNIALISDKGSKEFL